MVNFIRKFQTPSRRFSFGSFFCCLALLFSSSTFSQDFIFDFDADPGSGHGFPQIQGAQFGAQPNAGTCNRDGLGACYTDIFTNYLYNPAPGDCSVFWCPGGGIQEGTPFHYEQVELNGQGYIHMIIGLPQDGFAMELYIRGADNQDSTSRASWASKHSLGYNNSPGNSMLQDQSAGTGNPEKVAIRQVIGGAWDDATKTWTCSDTVYCSEYLKDTLLTKPKITQKISDVNMSAEFMVDMRNIGYREDMSGTGFLSANTVAPMVNTVTITAPNMFQGNEGNYDMSAIPRYVDNVDKEVITADVQLTAARFTYTEGIEDPELAPGDTEYTFGAGGTYNYYVDNFDVTNVDWCSYYTEDQNQPEASICD